MKSYNYKILRYLFFNIYIFNSINVLFCLTPNYSNVGSYNFNGTLNDDSGNGNHLSAMGSGGGYTTGRFGNSNSAYNIVSGSYLEISSPTGLAVGSEPRKVSLWFNSSNVSTASDVLFHWGTTSTSQSFGLATGTAWGSPFGINVFGWGNDAMVTATININTWYFIEVEYYLDTVYIFLDGSLLSKQRKVWNTASGTSLRIGLNKNGGDQFEGAIDDMSVDYGEIPLPIKLNYFTSSLEKSCVLLEWQTSSEINNDYFIIERSSDMNLFNEIAKISGHKNSTKTINYQFNDCNPNIGNNYYRLVQKDLDGKITRSKIIYERIDYEVIEDHQKIEVYPNPSQKDLYVYVKSDLFDFTVYDLSGRFININQIKVSNSEIILNIENLKNGIYFLKFKDAYLNPGIISFVKTN